MPQAKDHPLYATLVALPGNHGKIATEAFQKVLDTCFVFQAPKIREAFTWADTPQGGGFWLKYHLMCVMKP